ncbi:hypothetical protein K503DRAFT_798946 [Rhizopogon vinicolor AM-OR11-026]|uniref:Uncharacterized protein n=1 Tax=Rhizopogon vinicolor AM-OR11-026 TaxID=1314800 RepID=A0A1B7N632_9AGAM|nr:hypothetical protein K503DRAFT_798946 [Rhizopogon vinicolor AM-OR11-026]
MPSSTERRRRELTTASRTPTPSLVDDDENTPLAVFFAQFESFSFNARQSSHKNFKRLIKAISSDPNDPERRAALKGFKNAERRAARKGFKDALVQDFNKRFGTDGNDLAAWQNLCNVLRIVSVPATIQECRQRIRDLHINLVDLVDRAKIGRPVRVFASLHQENQIFT